MNVVALAAANLLFRRRGGGGGGDTRGGFGGGGDGCGGIDTDPSFLGLFLQGILFALTFTAAQAFGGESLVTKGCPSTKVLAALAPFDFKTTRYYNPNINVAQRTESLVLRRNNGVAVALVAQKLLRCVAAARCQASMVGRRPVDTAFVARSTRLLLFTLATIRAGTGLTTHDTASHSFRKIDRLFLRHVNRKINQAGKLGQWRSLHLVQVALEFRRNWRL